MLWRRITIALALCWLGALLPNADAFVSRPLKGQSAQASSVGNTVSTGSSSSGVKRRPSIVPSRHSGGDCSTTALHADAKKKKAAASAKRKKAATQVETVKKAELVSQMSDVSGLNKQDSELALNAFMEVVQENIAEGKKVTLIGFGSFVLKERAARKGRNPQTGEEMDIPASKSPGFTPAKVWKARVNET